jgi:hypothetical protein
MLDLAASFPRRPLKLHKTGLLPGIISYFSGLLLLGLAGFMGYLQVPGILNDITIAQNPVVVANSTITRGRCETQTLIFVSCEAHVTYTVKSKTFERNVSFWFLDPRGDSYDVEVVRSGDRPQIATLSLGLEMLWNRILFSAALIGLIAFSGLALFRTGWRADRVRALARKELPMTPVPVTITANKKVVGAQSYAYRLPAEGRQRSEVFSARLGRTQEPFWLNAETGEALAVLQEGGTMPVLLDAELTSLELTPGERLQIMTARNGVTSGRRRS